MVSYSENYRGIQAAEDIKKGETVFSMPMSMLMTYEKATEEPLGQLMYEKNMHKRLKSHKIDFLASWTLYEMSEKRRETSFWKLHMDALPTDVSEFPIFFGEEDKKWLEGTQIKNTIENVLEVTKGDYDLLCSEIPEWNEFSYD